MKSLLVVSRPFFVSSIIIHKMLLDSIYIHHAGINLSANFYLGLGTITVPMV